MVDAVIQRNSVGGTGAEKVLPRLPAVDPATTASAENGAGVSNLSEAQTAWLDPEFTRALAEHMHEAKRLAILDHQE